MFFKKNIAVTNVVHHAEMSKRAITFNVVACIAWVAVFGMGKKSGIGGLAFAPFGILVFVAALYVHLSGLAYSFVLAGKCKMYGRALSVFVASAIPLLAIAAFFIWGGS